MPERTSGKRKTKTLPLDKSHVGQIFTNYSQLPHHQSSSDSANQMNFYEQYKRVLGISHQIQKQLKNQSQLKEELLEKLAQLQKNMQNNPSEPVEKSKPKNSIKKRSRRMAEQIQRQFKCSVQYCEKQYGSEGSLMQHIKLKHPQIYYSKI